jgi:hypothetical protein
LNKYWWGPATTAFSLLAVVACWALIMVAIAASID